MPFQPGETVRLHHASTTPESVVLEFLGQRYTMANGGLELKRKGRLVVEVRLPRERGKYSYAWTDGEQTSRGDLRVQGAQRKAPREAAFAPAPRYRGPGSSR